MGEELSLDNILEVEEINTLFSDIDDLQDSSSESEDNEDSEKESDNKKKDKETTEVNSDELFEDQPESVGSGKAKEGQEDASSEEEGTSPNSNFYSSIAKALKEEGIFPDLDDETYNKVTDAEGFRDLVEQQIQAGLEERQKRIYEALNAGVEPTEIQRYEGTLNYLDNITDELITKENEQGEDLRKRLITQDLINRGYKEEQIKKKVKQSFELGTDVEDAKEALESNKTFFQKKYDDMLQEVKEEAENEKKSRREQAEKLKKSILEDKNVFGDLVVDKSTRQRVYDNIIKPVYKDPDTGEFFTAIQKYERENPTEFLKMVGLTFTLTDGFKDIDGLVKGKVKKEVKKGLKELETTLNNTARNSDGSLNFASGVKDSNSYFNGLALDI